MVWKWDRVSVEDGWPLMMMVSVIKRKFDRVKFILMDVGLILDRFLILTSDRCSGFCFLISQFFSNAKEQWVFPSSVHAV